MRKWSFPASLSLLVSLALSLVDTTFALVSLSFISNTTYYSEIIIKICQSNSTQNKRSRIMNKLQKKSINVTRSLNEVLSWYISAMSLIFRFTNDWYCFKANFGPVLTPAKGSYQCGSLIKNLYMTVIYPHPQKAINEWGGCQNLAAHLHISNTSLHLSTHPHISLTHPYIS